VYIPPNGSPGVCRAGATNGVDPLINEFGGGQVDDSITSSPTIGPDGSVYIGTFTRYNWAQGHEMHFDANGNYLNSYIYGWDNTPGIYSHDGTYSVIFKQNNYGNAAEGGLGSYCDNNKYCPPNRSQVYP